MGYLRKRDTGAVTDFLADDSPEYQMLRAMKFQSDVTLSAPSGPGIPAGATSGGLIKAGQPIWEEIAEEDVAADPPGGRVVVLRLDPAATAAAETSTEEFVPEVAGTLTDVEYVSDPAGAGIAGQATNNRVVTLQQVQLAGTATVTRTVQALASVTFGAGVNSAPGVPTPMTITTAAFQSGAPLSVASTVNGTGLPDPGGIVYAVYTRS